MSTLLRIILNPQIQLIIKAGANRRCKNLPIATKVAVVIPNKYKSAGFCDIVFANYSQPGEPLRYYCINLNHAAYIPLYYVLLFPYGDPSWH